MNEEDLSQPEIKSAMKDLDAWSWVYYNGVGTSYKADGVNKADTGLYWTTEDLTTLSLTNKTANGRSDQQVLSYYYDDKTKTYYVIKNYVWMNQGDVKNTKSKGLALSARSAEWEKPTGEIVGFASTYAEAQKIYNSAKSGNNGSVVFAPN